MDGILAGGEVNDAVKPGLTCLVEKVERVGAAVDDCQGLRPRGKRRDQRAIVHLADKFQPGAAQLLAQHRRVRRQLAPFETEAVRLERLIAERRLRRRAEHHGCAVVVGQFLDGPHDRDQERSRQRLRLVEHDHRTGDVVQFATARRSVREQALEQLHVGGDDDRRVPVLARKLQLVSVGAAFLPFLVERRMVFENSVVAEHLAEDVGRLVDHRREGDGVDDSVEPVGTGMLQREGERGQRLAAAGRHRQGEQALRVTGAGTDMGENVGPQPIDRVVGRRGYLLRHIGVEAGNEAGQQIGQTRPRAVDGPPFDTSVELLGVLEIGVGEAGKQHAAEHGEREAPLAVGIELPVRSKAFQQRRDVARPRRIKTTEIELGEACIERVTVAGPVGKPGVMAGDGIGHEVGHQPVDPGPIALADKVGAGQRMLDRRAALEPSEEALGRLAYVMVAPGKKSGALHAEHRRHHTCDASDGIEMVGQRLPITATGVAGGMRVVHLNPREHLERRTQSASTRLDRVRSVPHRLLWSNALRTLPGIGGEPFGVCRSVNFPHETGAGPKRATCRSAHWWVCEECPKQRPRCRQQGLLLDGGRCRD
uniref:hypothetical protein n=1 Tax=Pleomorphomonas sp. T1.2MG-36 TaxID=3041167 RepID=UPI00254170CA|nr:hypothetical protein [Pleomorphomonas sp. T1.2MG-36]